MTGRIGTPFVATQNDMTVPLNLSYVSESLRDQAAEAFNKGDAIGFLESASSNDNLRLLAANISLLKEKGIYEEALAHAYTVSVPNYDFSQYARDLFSNADRARLLELCPPPDPIPSIMYRGLGGKEYRRNVNGLSWTSSLEIAKRFARRAVAWDMHDPDVYRLNVNRDWVIAYTNEREEHEYILMLPSSARPTRLDLQLTE